MTVKQRAWQTLCEPKFGKPVKIIVWKNKEFQCPGQEITLHPKYLRSWNAVLGFITLVLQPRFGAVRKLYHLESRKLVLCLQEIKSNQKYVAVGAEKAVFKKNGYLTEEEAKLEKSQQQKGKSGVNSVDHFHESLANFMAYTKKNKRTVVYFMVSGRTCQNPIKVVLIERDLLDYNMILEYLAHRLDVGEGIQYLCNHNGKTVSHLTDLAHGSLYVAVPYGTGFIKLDYKDLFNKLMPPKKTHSSLERRKKPSKPRSASQPRHKPPEKSGDGQKDDEDEDELTQDEDEETLVAKEVEAKPIKPQNQRYQEDEVLEEDDEKQFYEEDYEEEEEATEIEEQSPIFVSKMLTKESTQGVLAFKCIGEKCVDAMCRVQRREFASVPTSIDNMQVKQQELKEQIQDTIEEIVIDVKQVKELLDVIVDDGNEGGMVHTKDQGVSPHSVEPKEFQDIGVQHQEPRLSGEAPDFFMYEDDLSPTTDMPNIPEKNLTTFADIAKNKKNQPSIEPIFAFDMGLSPQTISPQDTFQDLRISTFSKKGVSFMQVNTPTVISEGIEDILQKRGSRAFSVVADPTDKVPRMSILRRRTSREKLLSINTEPVPVEVRTSFLNLRSSVTNPFSQQVQKRLSDMAERGVDIIHENIEVAYWDGEKNDDKDDENENAEREKEGVVEDEEKDTSKSITKDVYSDNDSLDAKEIHEEEASENPQEEAEIEEEASSAAEKNENSSKAVQKNWRLNEEIFDQSVQAKHESSDTSTQTNCKNDEKEKKSCC